MDAARDALIVAISEYRDPKLQRLRAPAADAESLARVLGEASIGGFRVQLARDEAEAELRRRLARFFTNRRPDDLLLLHFSCHGIKDASGELYLAAVDTEAELLSATGIPSRWLNEQIGHCRSKRIVLLLDCCFSGSFPFGVQARAGGQLNVQDHLHGRGRAVITASNAMEYSFEGDELSGTGQPSIFTAAVVQALETGEADRDGDHWISVDELYDYVYDRVREKTPNQNPTKQIRLEGPLYIARSSYQRPVKPVQLSKELLALTESPLAGARLGAIEELSSLLRSSDPAVALSACQALERMLDDDSRRVSERAQRALTSGPASQETKTLKPVPNRQQPPESHGPPQSIAKPEPKPAAAPPAEPEIETEPAAAAEPRDTPESDVAPEPEPIATPESEPPATVEPESDSEARDEARQFEEQAEKQRERKAGQRETAAKSQAERAQVAHKKAGPDRGEQVAEGPVRNPQVTEEEELRALAETLQARISDAAEELARKYRAEVRRGEPCLTLAPGYVVHAAIVTRDRPLRPLRSWLVTLSSDRNVVTTSRKPRALAPEPEPGGPQRSPHGTEPGCSWVERP